MWRNQYPQNTVSGNIKWCRWWKTLWQFLKVKHTVTLWPRYTSKRNKNMSQNLYTNVCSNIIHNVSKVETTQILINWWTDNKMKYIYTMEYYWAIKRDKLLIYSTIWMILKSITLVMTEDRPKRVYHSNHKKFWKS